MPKKNATSDIVKLKDVRLSFPILWRPRAFEAGKEPQYQATFLLDPTDSAHAKMIKQIKKAARDVIAQTWGEKPDDLNLCFGLADKHKKKRKYDGYKGMFYLASANVNKPTLVDRKREDVVESDGVLYAGCYVNTNITLWTYDHPTGGPGIGCNLRIIQFVRDGEAFGNAPAKADEELDDVVIEDDEDMEDGWDEDEDDDDL